MIASSTGILPARDTSSTSGSSSSSSAITNAAGGEMGKDQFVKLLVTEMQNQDPLNPMDGKELAVQLAQFSSVEQLMNVNTKLDDLASILKTQQGSITGTGTATTGTSSTSATG